MKEKSSFFKIINIIVFIIIIAIPLSGTTYYRIKIDNNLCKLQVDMENAKLSDEYITQLIQENLLMDGVTNPIVKIASSQCIRSVQVTKKSIFTIWNDIYVRKNYQFKNVNE